MNDFLIKLKWCEMKFQNCVLTLFLCCLFSTITFAQERRTVSGRMIDESRQGIPGVTVTVKGTNDSVMSNNMGNFSIQASANDVLEVTSIGYEKSEFPVGTNATLDITLRTAAGSLSEVVVTALGVSKAQRGI